MAHRALVAYRRPPDAYALHYAHWGDGLADAIGHDTPFGGPAAPSVAPVVDTLADLADVDARSTYAQPPTRVDPRPLVRRAGPEAVVAAVDPSVESLVVVDADYAARTYLVCEVGFGPEREGSDPPFVFARPREESGALREWVVETRSAIDAAVARGALTPAAARATFERALADRAAVWPADDASFLRAG